MMRWLRLLLVPKKMAVAGYLLAKGGKLSTRIASRDLDFSMFGALAPIPNLRGI